MQGSRRARARISIIALVIVGLFIPAAIVMAQDKFTDVPNNNQFHDDIKALVETGVTQGCGPTTYCPNNNVTRGQMAAFLNRANALGAGKFPVSIAKPDAAVYCALAAREPGSYPEGPCRATTVHIDTGNFGDRNAIAIAPDGLPSIAFRSGFGDGVFFTHCADPACSTFSEPQTVDALNSPGVYVSLAYGVDGLPLIAYKTDTGKDLVVSHCGDAVCTTAQVTTTTVDSDATNEFGSYVSLQIGSDGLPVIAHQDTTDNEVRVVHCGNLRCNAGITLSGGFDSNVGNGGDMAIGADGYPVILHNDGTDNDIYVSHCTNVTCTTRDAATLIYNGTNTQESTIAIGTDGFPVIAFEEGVNDDIVVIHCKSFGCTSRDLPFIVDSSADMEAPILAIGLDGSPVIAYYDSTNDAIRIADCSTLTCSSSTKVSIEQGLITGVGVLGFAIGVDGRPIVGYEHSDVGGLAVSRPAL